MRLRINEPAGVTHIAGRLEIAREMVERFKQDLSDRGFTAKTLADVLSPESVTDILDNAINGSVERLEPGAVRHLRDGEAPPIIEPQAVNSSWFAALNGSVERLFVIQSGGKDSRVRYVYAGGSTEHWVPDSFDVEAGSRIWVASTPSTPDLAGFGTCASEAIANFNLNMVKS